MTERILIIEDDSALAEFMRWQLEREGFQARTALRAADGLATMREWRPDVVILDIMMPDMDGWTACQRIHEISDVPIIFSTALGQEKDIVRGLELGADDYLVKPFGSKELTARIRNVLRRHKPSDHHERIYRNGNLMINLDTRQVLLNGQEIELAPMEYKLLTCLAEQEGKVLSHRFLIEQVWGPDHENARHYLKLYIWYLRQKLEANPSNPRMILTQRSVGYRLVRAPDTGEK